MHGSEDIGFINPILHPRLRSLDLSGGDSENISEAINLPSLEEWTMNMGCCWDTVAATLSLLKRSGCRLKVLNFGELYPPSEDDEDLGTLIESIPLERIRLFSVSYRGGDMLTS